MSGRLTISNVKYYHMLYNFVLHYCLLKLIMSKGIIALPFRWCTSFVEAAVGAANVSAWRGNAAFIDTLFKCRVLLIVWDVTEDIVLPDDTSSHFKFEHQITTLAFVFTLAAISNSLRLYWNRYIDIRWTHHHEKIIYTPWILHPRQRFLLLRIKISARSRLNGTRDFEVHFVHILKTNCRLWLCQFVLETPIEEMREKRKLYMALKRWYKAYPSQDSDMGAKIRK